MTVQCEYCGHHISMEEHVILIQVDGWSAKMDHFCDKKCMALNVVDPDIFKED